jgi:Rod binding domain-containing protein
MLDVTDTSMAYSQAQQAVLANGITGLGKGKSLQQIQKSAQDFEAVFATEMLNPMFEGVEVDQTFGGGHGEEMFRTLVTEQYGKQIAKDDSLGMAKEITDALLRIQEGKH